MYLKIRKILDVAFLAIAVLTIGLREILPNMLASRFGIEGEGIEHIIRTVTFVGLGIAMACLALRGILAIVSKNRMLISGNYSSPYFSFSEMNGACLDKLDERDYHLYESIKVDQATDISVYYKQDKKTVTAVAIMRAEELTEENSERLTELFYETDAKYRNELYDQIKNVVSYDEIFVWCTDRVNTVFKRLVNISEEQDQACVHLTVGTAFDEGIVYIAKLNENNSRSQGRQPNLALYNYERLRTEACRIMGLSKDMLIEQER